MRWRQIRRSSVLSIRASSAASFSGMMR